MGTDNKPIRFFHRGRIVDVTGAHPTGSVPDWLREDERCSTKEGCSEVACTVVVNELAEDGALGASAATAGRQRPHPVSAHPAWQGAVTVEALKAQSTAYAPVRTRSKSTRFTCQCIDRYA